VIRARHDLAAIADRSLAALTFARPRPC